MCDSPAPVPTGDNAVVSRIRKTNSHLKGNRNFFNLSVCVRAMPMLSFIYFCALKG